MTGQPPRSGQEKVNQAGTFADRPTASERLAAVVALAGLLAAAVLLLVGIAVKLGAVILALAGVLVCVTACWYLVARRGLIRVIAAIVALAALAAVVAGFFLANISIWRVVVIAVVAGLAVASGRYALRRTPRALRSAVSGLPAAGPARHPVLIMNLKSGAARPSATTWRKSAGNAASSRSSCGPATACRLRRADAPGLRSGTTRPSHPGN